jgi:hypothetical protein
MEITFLGLVRSVDVSPKGEVTLRDIHQIYDYTALPATADLHICLLLRCEAADVGEGLRLELRVLDGDGRPMTRNPYVHEAKVEAVPSSSLVKPYCFDHTFTGLKFKHGGAHCVEAKLNKVIVRQSTFWLQRAIKA